MNLVVSELGLIFLPRELVGLMLIDAAVYARTRELNRHCRDLVDKLLPSLQAKSRFTTKTIEHEDHHIITTGMLPNGKRNGLRTSVSYGTAKSSYAETFWLSGERIYLSLSSYGAAGVQNWWRRASNTRIVGGLMLDIDCCYTDKTGDPINYDITYANEIFVMHRNMGECTIEEAERGSYYQITIRHRVGGHNMLPIMLDFPGTAQWWDIMENEYWLLGALLEEYPGVLYGDYPVMEW